MSIRIGVGPVSFGVYGGIDDLATSPKALLGAASAAGYGGMELGPPGFFGSAQATRSAFAEHGLQVAGAYVPIHFGGTDVAFRADLLSMQRTLDELCAGEDPPGLAILADEGSPELLLNPARDPRDRRLALDDDGWLRLADRVTDALALAEAAGVSGSFHPHISTYVESAWEVERLLETTPVGLTLDTGHFQLAGADPTAFASRYRDRLNHVHVKDVRVNVLERAKAMQRTDFDLWWGDVSTPLGEGDVDLVTFLERLHAQGYDGWLVVEQDRLPLGRDPIEPVIEAQAHNRRWLEAALQRLTVAHQDAAMETGDD
jgi:inosose dehydratase